MSDIRLDKYLWAVRIFKTRSDAADAIRQNRVLVNDAYAKPSREVKVGDRISVRRERVNYSYKVLDLVSSRQPAKNVPLYCLNCTPLLLSSELHSTCSDCHSPPIPLCTP